MKKADPLVGSPTAHALDFDAVGIFILVEREGSGQALACTIFDGSAERTGHGCQSHRCDPAD